MPSQARAGLFGASILGPMILTAALLLGGIVTTRPPAEIIRAAHFFIRIVAGVKHTGITGRKLRRDLGAGIAHAGRLALISLGFFELIYLTGMAPALDAFVAFLPEGQDALVGIAIIAGADLAFVVTLSFAGDPCDRAGACGGAAFQAVRNGRLLQAPGVLHPRTPAGYL